MYRDHYGQGNYYCSNCRHAVYARFGGCRTCRMPVSQLMLLDLAIDQGMIGDGFDGGISYDPFDGDFAFNIPGTNLAVEPSGQLDLDIGGIGIPLGSEFDDGGFNGGFF